MTISDATRKALEDLVPALREASARRDAERLELAGVREALDAALEDLAGSCPRSHLDLAMTWGRELARRVEALRAQNARYVDMLRAASREMEPVLGRRALEVLEAELREAGR